MRKHRTSCLVRSLSPLGQPTLTAASVLRRIAARIVFRACVFFLARQRSIGLAVASQSSSFQGGPGLRATAPDTPNPLERPIDKVPNRRRLILQDRPIGFPQPQATPQLLPYAAFTHLLWGSSEKCDRVIRTLFNGTALGLDNWEVLCRDRNSYSLSIPPEVNADIELVSCRELIATSKRLLGRAGRKSKATGCRIK
jgi:hypothetical protein